MDGLASVYLEKDMIRARTVGFTQELLDIFKGLQYQHPPLPLRPGRYRPMIRDQWTSPPRSMTSRASPSRNACTPTCSKSITTCACLSPVGIGMKDTPGTMATAANALYQEGINIEIVDQGRPN